MPISLVDNVTSRLKVVLLYLGYAVLFSVSSEKDRTGLLALSVLFCLNGLYDTSSESSGYTNLLLYHI